MPRPVVVAIVFGLLSPFPLAAQWRIGVDFRVEQVGRFVRSAPNQGEEGPDGRPTQAWPLALRLERGGDGLRAALAVSRVATGLELFGSDLTVALRPGFEVLTVTPEVSGRLSRLDGNGQLRAGLALPLERWSFPTYADPPRWRAGLAADLTAEWPISSRFNGRIGASLGTVFRHPLADTELIEDYQATRMWRRALHVGVAWMVRGGRRT